MIRHIHFMGIMPNDCEPADIVKRIDNLSDMIPIDLIVPIMPVG